MEDQRHVGVECFYDVHEVVPSATKQTVLVEVPEKGRYWGITRRYPPGSRDRHVPSDGASDGGLKVIRVEVVQEPIPEARFLEKALFNVTCCKACRADFLALFGRWASGEFVQPEGEGDIPVRVLGAVRLVNEDEFERLRTERDEDE